MKVYQTPAGPAPPPNGAAAPKVVGPNIMGTKEEYQLVRRLQSALFGGVYEAKGLSSLRDFAIKVLHKSELSKAQKVNKIEFCEVPLSEIRFAELMRGSEHVMEAEDHFEDAYCFYIVFELARGGDLLEALKQKPNGFDEAQAQFLIKQATKGLAYLHQRRVAMQDVSLENLLLHVSDSSSSTAGQYQIKVCDPGQAVVFEVDPNTGEELPVKFRGLVGKSFRPLELHAQEPYCSTKVDAWCLGWSTFYLLTAQPLFMSADPAQQDPDWALFKNGEYAKLYQQKQCSLAGLDFILRLLQLDPKRRMSIAEAQHHEWLQDPRIPPMFAPKELLPPKKEDREKEAREAAAANEEARAEREAQAVRASPAVPIAQVPSSPEAYGDPERPFGMQAGTSSPTIGGNQLARNVGSGYPLSGQPVRVRSPIRSPRSGPMQAPQLDRGDPRSRGQPTVGAPKMTHVRSSSSSISNWVQSGQVLTRNQSPVPTSPTSPPHSVLSRAPVRGTSPLSSSNQRTSHTALHSPLVRSPSPGLIGSTGDYRPEGAMMYLNAGPSSQPAFHTPRSNRPPNIAKSSAALGINGKSSDDIDGSRGRAWAFRSSVEGVSLDGSQNRNDSDLGDRVLRAPRTSSPGPTPVAWSQGAATSSALLLPSANARQAQSPPPRSQMPSVGFGFPGQRSLSPLQTSSPQSRVPRLQAFPMKSNNGSQAREAVQPIRQAQSPRTSSPTTIPAEAGVDAQYRGRSLTRPISPRLAGPIGTPSTVIRGASPGFPESGAVIRGASPGAPMVAQSKLQGRPRGFAWSPEPPSPPAPTRSFSPAPMGQIQFSTMKGGRPTSNGTMPRWFG